LYNQNLELDNERCRFVKCKIGIDDLPSIHWHHQLKDN
jgi:hypothetical protein